jgi:hypothetical protein
MRACFHGHNIFALGNGTAKLLSPPLSPDAPDPDKGKSQSSRPDGKDSKKGDKTNVRKRTG